MSRSVEIKTPIPSAEEIADRLGVGVKRQRMLLGFVHGKFVSVHRNSKAGSFVLEKSASRSKSDKRAKAKP